MLSRTAVLALVLATTVPALGKPPEKPSLRITELPGVNPGGDGTTFVTDMNDRGTVVGGSIRSFSGGTIDDFRARPVKWSEKGVMTELPALSEDGFQGGVHGINANGKMVGFGHVAGLDELGAHALVLGGDPPTDLGTLLGDDFSNATRVNNAGTVVGWSGPELFFFGGSTAVRWDKNGIQSLGKLPGDIDSEAYGINEAGVIVGASGDLYLGDDGSASAVYWDKSGIHALAGRLGDFFSTASAINDAGVIVGATAGIDQMGPFFPFSFATIPVRWVKGTIEELPLLPGDNAGAAFAINAGGTIVGESSLVDEFGFPIETHPVVWVDGEAIDLNDVSLDTTGWVFERVTAVNDKGQVAGVGTHDGVKAGFLATPKFGPKWK